VSELSEAERQAVITALFAYREETVSYLRNYDRPDITHEDCCAVARARAARRRDERDSLKERLRTIDAALMTLDPAGAR
jgi:hypothetical protein